MYLTLACTFYQQRASIIMSSTPDSKKLLPEPPLAGYREHHLTDNFQGLESHDSFELFINDYRTSDKPFSVRTTREKSETLTIKALKRLAIILHIILALLHFALLIILVGRLDSRIILQVTENTTFYATVINTAAQVFIIAYSALLLLITQNLSLRRALTTRQTLTATHDHADAWTGLGAALMTLTRQISAPASIRETALITAYLAGLSTLHITTPSLFSVQLVNATSTIQSNMISYSDINTIGWRKLSTALNSSFDFSIESLAFAVNQISDVTTVEYPSVSDLLPTLGLQDGIIYDVITEPALLPGNFTVGALTFNVSCGYLENTTVSLKTLNNQNTSKLGETDNRQYINLNWKHGNTSCDFPVPMPGINISTWMYHQNPALQGTCNGYGPKAGILFTSTVLGKNNTNDELEIVPVSPDLTRRLPKTDYGSIVAIPENQNVPSFLQVSNSSTVSLPSAFQIMGCTLGYKKSHVTVDSQTGVLISYDDALTSTSYSDYTKWALWDPHFENINLPQWTNGNLSLLEAWPLIFSPTNTGNINWMNDSDIYCTRYGTNSSDYCGLSAQNIPPQEEYITNFFSRNGTHRQWGPIDTSSNVSVLAYYKGDIEQALASMTTAYYWNALKIASLDSNFYGNMTSKNTVYGVGLYIAQSYLRLNLIPVIVGLCSSVGLTFIIFIFTRDLSTAPTGSGIWSLSVLETIWLLKQHPDLLQAIGEVEGPTIKNLRVGGMIPALLTAPIDENTAKEANGGSESGPKLVRSRRRNYSLDQEHNI